MFVRLWSWFSTANQVDAIELSRIANDVSEQWSPLYVIHQYWHQSREWLVENPEPRHRWQHSLTYVLWLSETAHLSRVSSVLNKYWAVSWSGPIQTDLGSVPYWINTRLSAGGGPSRLAYAESPENIRFYCFTVSPAIIQTGGTEREISSLFRLWECIYSVCPHRPVLSSWSYGWLTGIISNSLKRQEGCSF